MATATLRFRINDGPLQSLSVIDTPANLADAKVSLSATSYVGWGQPAAVWVIAEYPDGFACPDGWTTHEATGSYRYTADPQTGTTPPDFYLPSTGDINAGQWGKFEFRLVVNGTIYSVKVGIEITSPAGLHDLAAGEEAEFGGTQRLWVGPQKGNLRVLNDLLNSGGAALLGHYLEDAAAALNTNGVPIQAMTSALAFIRLLATSSATADVLDICRSTGGAGNNDDGARLRMRLPNLVGVLQTAGTISAEIVNKSVIGGFSTRLVLGTTTGGTLYPGLTLSAAGAVRFNGSIYASAGGRLVVDASGNVTLQAITEAELRVAAATLTTSLDVNAQKVTNLADGTSASDAATYGQLLAAVQGLSIKASVRAATVANITLSGNQTVDGVALVDDDEVLVKNQSTGAENGLYVVASGAWARRTDLAAGAHAAGAFVFVEEGTANADSGWVCTSDKGADVVDSDSLAFVQFSGAGQITAGAGLTKTGNTLDVVAADGTITVNANSIEATGAFGSKNVGTTGSVTAGASGFIGPAWDRASAGALTLGGSQATSIACSGLGITKCISVSSDGALALSSASGDASLDADGSHKAKVGTSTANGTDLGRSGKTTTINGSVVTITDSLATYTNRVEGPRFTAQASKPTSSSNAVTFDLSASQNVEHATTENTTVTISGGVWGQRGTIVVSQGGSAHTITMPTNGIGVEYDDSIIGLGVTAIIDTSTNKRTVLDYYVLENGKAYIKGRSVGSIP